MYFLYSKQYIIKHANLEIQINYFNYFKPSKTFIKEVKS